MPAKARSAEPRLRSPNASLDFPSSPPKKATYQAVWKRLRLTMLR